MKQGAVGRVQPPVPSTATRLADPIFENVARSCIGRSSKQAAARTSHNEAASMARTRSSSSDE